MDRSRLRRTALRMSLVLSLGTTIPAPAAGPATPGPAALPPGVAATAPVTQAATLTLADVEQMALRGNPTLAQAAANVEAARGRALQAGLYPNPTAGYEADRIGAAGTAGELQGAFIDQTVVTAGKLRLSRAKYAHEVSQMEAQALAQQYRVLNGVRVRFYQLLAMQRLLDVRADLLRVAEDAVTTTDDLVNVGAANKADLLQARIEARQERVSLENARALYLAGWQQLAAFVGRPSLPAGRLQGDLESPGAAPDYETALCHLLEASPEIQAARAEVARNQAALRREQVEPTPNVQVRVSNGYDFETRNDVTSLSVGVRLPLFDKNQGNIHAASAQLAYAQAEVGRVELSLRQRLARAYARYRTAQSVVQAYREGNLADARQAYELYLESFRARRAAWPQVLVAQRSYLQISVDYVEALEQLRRAEVTILGLLLVDGLDEPPGPPGEGRAPRREQPPDLPDPISSGEGRGPGERVGATGAGQDG
jgi:cobalt-zinc-cadmium efflux system outer membrane protein